MEENEVHAICKICNKIIRTGEDFVKPGLVGIETINKASKERCSVLLAIDFTTNAAEAMSISGISMKGRNYIKVGSKRFCFFCGHVVSICEKQTKNASEVLLSKFVKDTR